MRRHPIDPLSAALGLAAIAAGLVVAVGRADSLMDDAAWWIALLALLLGIALVPWNRDRESISTSDAPQPHALPDAPMTPAPQHDILQLPPVDSDR